MTAAKATTVKQYLDALPEARRKVLSKVRAVIRRNLPKGYEEAMNYGVISYQVPLKRLPNTYNGQPLSYAALAVRKDYYALYMMGPYGSVKQRVALEKAFADAG